MVPMQIHVWSLETGKRSVSTPSKTGVVAMPNLNLGRYSDAIDAPEHIALSLS